MSSSLLAVVGRRRVWAARLAFAWLVLAAASPAHSTSLLVTGNTILSAPAAYDSVVVTGTGVLTVDAPLTARNLLLIQSGGKVSHSDYAGGTIYKLELTIEPGGLLDIQSNGSIDASGKGLRGGVGRQNGEGYDATGVTITRVNGGRAGGSHGGRGGWQGALDNSGPAYGMADSPSLYGGGGGAFFNGLFGGDGGGIVLIHAPGATVRVDGSIRSNGLHGVDNGGHLANDTGGGAGGSITITCGAIEGVGTLEATGGSSGFLGGGGGGGRIAVFSESANDIVASQYGVSGGTAQGLGSGGTIYAQQVGVEPYGHVTIQGNTSQYETPLRLLVPHLAELVVRGGTLAVVEPDVNVDGSSDAVAVETSIGVSSASRLRFATGASVVASGLTVEAGGAAFLNANTGFQSTSLVVTGPGARLESDIDLDYRDAGDVFEVSNGGVIVNRAVFGLSVIDGTTLKGGANETVFYNEGTLLLPDVADEYVTITSGMTLAESGLLTPDDAIRLLTIQSGGKVTHSDYAGGTIYKLELTIAPGGTLDVQSNGSIDVSGKGLRGGVGRQNGEGYDASGVTITRVNGVRAGGSHGGRGGWQGEGDNSGPTYGVVDNPSLYGGGGGANFGGLFGGDGGGIVLIHAASATVRVDGSIRSNGRNGVDNGGHLANDTGGGAGGSIAITCGTIEGVGTLEANGGSANILGGCGGGGRIAMFYDTLLGFSTSNISAAGGGGAHPGGVGTVFVNSTRVGPDLTTADPFLTLTPDGSIVFRVTMRDSNGDPIVGETGVWLDFSGCTGLVPCPSIAATWPIVQQPAPSSAAGQVEFGVKAGGCTSESVAVRCAQGLVASVPIKSIDQNGGLIVSAFDFVGDDCNDYNADGHVDARDWDIFARYLGRTCITDASSYFTLDAFTRPGPDSLFLGTTIRVCGRITNLSPEPAVLDSVVFQTAGWGIANPWGAIGRQLSVPIAGHGSVEVSIPFTIPGDIPRHGCFRVHSYPTFVIPGDNLTSGRSVPEVIAFNPLSTNAGAPANSRQINRDSARPPQCPRRRPCPPPIDDAIKDGVGFFFGPGADQAVADGVLPGDLLDRLRCRTDPEKPFGPGCYTVDTNCHGNCGAEGDGIAVSPNGIRPPGCIDDAPVPRCTAYHELLHRGIADKSALGCPPGATPPPGVSEEDYVRCLTKALLPYCESSAACPGQGANPEPTSALGSGGRAHGPVNCEPAASTKLMFATTEVDSTIIPIGAAAGSQLRLYHRAFVPEGWSYSISHTGLIDVPNSIVVTITHPVGMACADTARVVVYAYTLAEEYAGEAEVIAHRVGALGDVDQSGTVDDLDVQGATDWLVQAEPVPHNLDAMEVNGDGRIDIADLTRLVDHVSGGGALDCISSSEAAPYQFEYYQDAGTTVILLDEARPIRGMQVFLVGTGAGEPSSPLFPEVELISYGFEDTLAVLMADLDGNAPITGMVAFSLPGQYVPFKGRIATFENYSADVEFDYVTPVPVLISTFSAKPTDSGTSLIWDIQADDEVLGFRLYRKNEQDEKFSPIASESGLAPSARSYTDTKVKGGHTYEYALGVVMSDGTKVLSQTASVTAKKFELLLFQNHPNPFNPTTTISFTVPERMSVSLAIYNVKGELVRTLLAESLAEGVHEVGWDGSSNTGIQVSSGVYFYRLVAGKRTLTRKMVLLK